MLLYAIENGYGDPWVLKNHKRKGGKYPMAIRQTRIFVPDLMPYDTENWAETLLGRVIQPLLQNCPTVDWFWFSRYIATSTDSGDCDISVIPKEFQTGGLFRSLRFRFQLSDANIQTFEQAGSLEINRDGCAISDWRDYDLVADLGGNRFVGEVRDNLRRRERANLVVSFLNSISRLVLNSLIGPDADGRFRAESNDDSQNPLLSSYESMHHLFCNMTALPLRVLVFSDGSQTFVGTDWSGPQQASWKVVQEIRIRY